MIIQNKAQDPFNIHQMSIIFLKATKEKESQAQPNHKYGKIISRLQEVLKTVIIQQGLAILCRSPPFLNIIYS